MDADHPPTPDYLRSIIAGSSADDADGAPPAVRADNLAQDAPLPKLRKEILAEVKALIKGDPDAAKGLPAIRNINNLKKEELAAMLTRLRRVARPTPRPPAFEPLAPKRRRADEPGDAPADDEYYDDAPPPVEGPALEQAAAMLATMNIGMMAILEGLSKRAPIGYELDGTTALLSEPETYGQTVDIMAEIIERDGPDNALVQAAASPYMRYATLMGITLVKAAKKKGTDPSSEPSA